MGLPPLAVVRQCTQHQRAQHPGKAGIHGLCSSAGWHNSRLKRPKSSSGRSCLLQGRTARPVSVSSTSDSRRSSPYRETVTTLNSGPMRMAIVDASGDQATPVPSWDQCNPGCGNSRVSCPSGLIVHSLSEPTRISEPSGCQAGWEIGSSIPDICRSPVPSALTMWMVDAPPTWLLAKASWVLSGDHVGELLVSPTTSPLPGHNLLSKPAT